MKKNVLMLLLSFASCAMASAQTTDPNLGIIPVPVSVNKLNGTLNVPKSIPLITSSVERLAPALESFARNIIEENTAGSDLVDANNGQVSFKINIDKSFNLADEGYKLTVNASGISIAAKTERGVFYGLQTLIQLFPADKTGKSATLPYVEINDHPRFAYRGMHLDVGRHMFPVAFIKQYIDLLAFYKINNFHWHLTEDQGWRIEIKKYPKLTTVGAYRDETLIGYYYDRKPQWFDGTPYGGFYTQNEVKDIVAYAATKYINVIPEIEMPGHALAALTAYPELGCTGGPYKVATKWGVFDDVFCAGNEQTFKFIEDVLDEVLTLFPSKYIHIGGDECPKTKWKTCPKCQQRMKDKKLKNEHELQSYFIQRVEKYLNGKGRSIIGWDEILEGGLAPNATVMSWTGVKGGIAAAKQKHNVIMTPGTNGLYFDHKEIKSDQEPVTIGGNNPLSRSYAYEPVPTELTPSERKYIIGVQANVWTEYMRTPAKVEYMVLPRIMALSEIAWSEPLRKDYKNFSEERVPAHLEWIDKAGMLYRVPTALGIKDTTLTGEKFTFDLKLPVKGSKIYYTIDTYNPRETDAVYDQPIQISVPKGEKRILKTIVITPSGKRSIYTTTVLDNGAPAPAPGDPKKGT